MNNDLDTINDIPHSTTVIPTTFAELKSLVDKVESALKGTPPRIAFAACILAVFSTVVDDIGNGPESEDGIKRARVADLQGLIKRIEADVEPRWH